MIIGGTGKTATVPGGASRMAKGNKAHTAAANRIAKRFGTTASDDGSPDVQTHEVTIEVETSATIRAAIRRLKDADRPAFVAVTNKEALVDALRYAHGTSVGVMDPHGEIVRQSEPALGQHASE
jgi:hypothetical protein